jgi:hypothetical protein
MKSQDNRGTFPRRREAAVVKQRREAAVVNETIVKQQS